MVGVTWISRSEVETGRRRGIVAGSLLQAMAVGGIAYAALITSRAITLSQRLPGWGLLALGMIVMVVGRADWRAIVQPIPSLSQRAVKTAVLSLVWLDVAAVAATRGPGLALVVAALFVPAFLLARWLYST